MPVTSGDDFWPGKPLPPSPLWWSRFNLPRWLISPASLSKKVSHHFGPTMATRMHSRIASWCTAKKFEPPNKHGFRAQASSLRLKKDSRRRLHSRGARRSERELRASPVRATRRGCSRARAERRRRPPASRRTSASPRLERRRENKKDAHKRRAFSPRAPGAPTRRAPAARRAIDSRVASRS